MLAFDFEDGNGLVPAHQHHRGLGWVADTATVDKDSYVGHQARVFHKAVVSSSTIYDSASVYNSAVVRSSTIEGTAEVYGNAYVFTANVYSNARVFGLANVGPYVLVAGVIHGDYYVRAPTWYQKGCYYKVAKNLVLHGPGGAWPEWKYDDYFTAKVVILAKDTKAPWAF